MFMTSMGGDYDGYEIIVLGIGQYGKQILSMIQESNLSNLKCKFIHIPTISELTINAHGEMIPEDYKRFKKNIYQDIKETSLEVVQYIQSLECEKEDVILIVVVDMTVLFNLYALPTLAKIIKDHDVHMPIYMLNEPNRSIMDLCDIAFSSNQIKKYSFLYFRMNSEEILFDKEGMTTNFDIKKNDSDCKIRTMSLIELITGLSTGKSQFAFDWSDIRYIFDGVDEIKHSVWCGEIKNNTMSIVLDEFIETHQMKNSNKSINQYFISIATNLNYTYDFLGKILSYISRKFDQSCKKHFVYLIDDALNEDSYKLTLFTD